MPAPPGCTLSAAGNGSCYYVEQPIATYDTCEASCSAEGAAMACATSQEVVNGLVAGFLRPQQSDLVWTRNSCAAVAANRTVANRETAHWMAADLDHYNGRNTDDLLASTLVLSRQPALLELPPTWNASAVAARCVCEFPPTPCGMAWDDTNTVNLCQREDADGPTAGSSSSSSISSSSISSSSIASIGVVGLGDDAFGGIRESAIHAFGPGADLGECTCTAGPTAASAASAVQSGAAGAATSSSLDHAWLGYTLVPVAMLVLVLAAALSLHWRTPPPVRATLAGSEQAGSARGRRVRGGEGSGGGHAFCSRTRGAASSEPTIYQMPLPIRLSDGQRAVGLIVHGVQVEMPRLSLSLPALASNEIEGGGGPSLTERTDRSSSGDRPRRYSSARTDC